MALTQPRGWKRKPISQGVQVICRMERTLCTAACSPVGKHWLVGGKSKVSKKEKAKKKKAKRKEKGMVKKGKKTPTVGSRTRHVPIKRKRKSQKKRKEKGSGESGKNTNHRAKTIRGQPSMHLEPYWCPKPVVGVRLKKSVCCCHRHHHCCCRHCHCC